MNAFDQALSRRCGQLLQLAMAPKKRDWEPLTQYAADPVGFAIDVLGVKLWDDQVEIAESVRDNPRTAVAACFSSGKTFVDAVICLWWLFTRRPAMVITTAPTGRQVRFLLWREMRKLHMAAKKKLPGKPLQLLLELAPDWFAMGFSSDRPANVAGLHEKRNVLFLEDEAADMNPDVVEAFRGITASAGSRHLKTGNPISTSGPFFDAFHKEQASWSLMHIDAECTPNYLAGAALAHAAGWRRGDRIPIDPITRACPFDVEVVPGLVMWNWVEDARQRWGESSPHWHQKVKGQFYLTAGEKVCPPSWVQAAQERWTGLPGGECSWEQEGSAWRKVWRDPADQAEALVRKLGLDVGLTHDLSVICFGVGGSYTIAGSFVGERPDLVADEVAAAILSLGIDVANIDATGVGIGAYGNLLRMQEEGKLPPEVVLHDIVFSRRPAEPGLYRRFVDELCWLVRNGIDPASVVPIALDPEDVELAQELQLRNWRLEDGRIHVDAKKVVKAKYGRSPDRADALMICMWEGRELAYV